MASLCETLQGLMEATDLPPEGRTHTQLQAVASRHAGQREGSPGLTRRRVGSAPCLTHGGSLAGKELGSTRLAGRSSGPAWCPAPEVAAHCSTSLEKTGPRGHRARVGAQQALG